MSWFSRNELADKVSALEQENEALRTDLQAAQASENQVPALTQEIAGLKEDLESSREALTTEESSHASTKQQLSEATAKLAPHAIAETIKVATASEEAESQPIRDAVEAHVTTAMAACGIPPLNIVNAEQEDAVESKLSREAFNALSTKQRNAFIREGGKLTD
jgi:hypothetical protein